MELLQQLNIGYLPYTLVVVALLVLAALAHKAKTSNFNVFDLLMDPATGKASVTKFWQNAGAGTATIAIIQAAGSHTLTADVLAIYLGALGVSEGWSKYVGAKYLGKDEAKD